MRTSSTGRSGQSLAEFALVLPVFLLIMAGIIQFGLIFWAQNTLNQVVRDTGRWAASQQNCDPAVEGPLVYATAKQIAARSSLIGYSATAWTPADVVVTWSGTPCPPTSNQQTAWIDITITHNKVPIFFPWIPGNGTVSSSTEFRMEPMPK